MTRGRAVPPPTPAKLGPPQLSDEEQRAFSERLAAVAGLPVSQAEQALAAFIAGPQSATQRLNLRLNARLGGATFVPQKCGRR